MPMIKLPRFECLRCGHKWHPAREEVPRSCAYCKSPYWDSMSTRGEGPKRDRHLRECRSPVCRSPAGDEAAAG